MSRLRCRSATIQASHFACISRSMAGPAHADLSKHGEAPMLLFWHLQYHANYAIRNSRRACDEISKP